ncbi:hypothetical protein K2W90_04060 [Candidatus Babeliales bacterium]|nr:hypothetical protein [Candidatus Babeliales bacterium]
MKTRFFERATKVLSLFFSLSTMVCCAFPVLFAFLGFGAAFSGLISIFPFLVTLSKYKAWLFLVGFTFLAINGYHVYTHQKTLCPTPLGAGHLEHTTGCDIATGWNKTLFWLSAGMLFFGFFMAYLAFPLFKFLGLV